MKEIVFKCDYCKKTLEGVHISLPVSKEQVGVAFKDEKLLSSTNSDWRIMKFDRIYSNALSFCDAECLGKFFDERLSVAKLKLMKT